MNEYLFQEQVKEDFHTDLVDRNPNSKGLDQSTEKDKEQPLSWAKANAAQLRQKLANLKSVAFDKVFVAGKTMEQDIDHSLNRYNVKVQNLADQVPGGLGRRAARYPWVTITISLAIGMLLGKYLIPARRPRFRH